MHRVVVLCLDGLVAFDLDRSGAGLSPPATPSGEPLYELLDLLGGRGRSARPAASGSRPARGLALLRRGATPSSSRATRTSSRRRPKRRWTRCAAPPPAAPGSMSVCTGAFALAHAGLLDGRRATTHWAWAAELAERFPGVEVERESLYVDEGRVMTSAGLSAGIDLGLHVVRKDFGAAVGARAARRMVAPPHREGGQAQFIERPQTDRHRAARSSRPGAGRSSACASRSTSPRWRATPRSARAPSPVDSWRRPGRPRTAGWSRAACWRPAGCSRRPRSRSSRSPGRSGFGSAASLREHFRRATATSPTAYRRSFRPVAA